MEPHRPPSDHWEPPSPGVMIQAFNHIFATVAESRNLKYEVS